MKTGMATIRMTRKLMTIMGYESRRRRAVSVATGAEEQRKLRQRKDDDERVAQEELDRPARENSRYRPLT
jgi:hypothetical protein